MPESRRNGDIKQALKSDVNIRLGIFLNSGTVIGDVALQSIDRANRSCSLGTGLIGIAKFENHGKGYGTQALCLIMEYAFGNLGLERITASTMEINIPAQKVLEKLGFILEGRERKAVYFRGRKYDNLNFGMLADEYIGKFIESDL